MMQITDDSFENVIGSAFDDVLTGNDENANELTGGDGDDELVGGDEDTSTDPTVGDTLKGGAGADELSGGGGNDTLEGGAGADELDGGDDPATTLSVADRSAAARVAANTLSYASSDAGVSVNLTVTARVSQVATPRAM